MRSLAGLTFAITLAFGGFAAVPDKAMAAEKMSHAHMGHVTNAWKETPDGMGLLPTAAAEAEIAAQHAGFAAQQPNNLEWMKIHVGHVLHAVDPAVEPEGPGLGYGVIKAAGGAAKHINFAAESDDASDNVRAHAVHVTASSENTVTRANDIVALGKRALAAASAEDVAALVQQIAVLADQLLVGVDANSDGTITWHEGEGGLNEAAKHMGFMAEGEGLS
ncbi:MAG: hypothetical protein ACTSX7_03675 [Alphaproteobacteria bacterium]